MKYKKFKLRGNPDYIKKGRYKGYRKMQNVKIRREFTRGMYVVDDYGNSPFFITYINLN